MPAKSLTERAFAHMRAQEYDAAIKDFTAALEGEREPDVRASVHSARALAYRFAGNFAKSIADYTAAITLHSPESGELAADYVERAEMYWGMGNDSAALADYDLAIGVDPSYASIYSSRAEYYIRHDRWIDAMTDYSTILHIYPGVIDILLLRGVAYVMTGRWDQAIKDLTLCIRNDTNEDAPYKDRAHKWRAEAYVGMSHVTLSNAHHYVQAAIADYQQYLAYIPEAEDRQEIEALIENLQER